MRIAMIGAGAMGAMFGARFAGSGADVVLYDIDKAHVDAIAQSGLRFETPKAISIVKLRATSDADSIGEADAAVILVDSNATKAAAAIAERILKPNGFVLTLQNGIGNVETLVGVLGPRRILAGTTYNSAAKLAPGRVLHSNIGETTIGEIDGSRSERIGQLAGLFKASGLPIEVSDNVVGHVWMKFILNAAINPVCAVTGLRPGEIARTAPARQLLEALLAEILVVINAKGVTLPILDPRSLVLDHAWERYNRPSMLQHVEQGRRTEIDSLNGALLNEARRLGIACPVNETIVLIVKSIEARNVALANTPQLDEAALEAVARAEKRRN